MLNVAAGTTERVAREVAYLVECLTGPGTRRVLDTGSATGERAIALARSGFDVVALQPTTDGVAAARARADAEGLPVRWAVGHALEPATWPAADVGAVICSDWWDRGTNRLRLLRRLRRHAPPDARLVLFASDDPAGGLPPVAALVGRAGFEVERGDLDFGRDRPGGGDHSVQVVARATASPPGSLAVSIWGSGAPMPVQLDLRYEPDEADFVDPRPADVWSAVCAETSGGASVAHYAVDDPFGSRRYAGAVARFFGCDLSSSQVTFGAGVTSLLHDLWGLADGGTIASDPLTHGDLEAWAIAGGSQVRTLSGSGGVGRLEREIDALRPALVHLDRPTFTGGVLDLDEVRRVAAAAARVDAVVLIDESALPYLGPAASAATLVNGSPNLVVLRGFTKAYSWGGLRAGFAVASPPVAPGVRELVGPLQVSEHSLAAACRMLEAGDIFERLRRRIRRVKPPTGAALERAGFPVLPGHPDLPWIALPDPGGHASRRLAQLGIRPLGPTRHPAAAAPADLVRITVPLSDERHGLLLEMLESATGGSHA